jgi:AcrR family transcriptional regulator
LGSTLVSVYVAHLSPGALPAAVAPTVRQGVFKGVAVTHALNSPVLLALVRSAFVHGMDDALVVSVGFAAAGVLLALLFLPSRFGTGPQKGRYPMNGLPPEVRPAAGLRERKKAKTRSAIQHEALRLFRQQGYDATTVEQIAEAAEVSASRLFRYFASKEGLVLSDDYDPLIIEACRSQAAELGLVETIRHGLRSVFESLDDEELSDMWDRAELALSVPDLRAAMLDQFAQVIRQLTDVVAERAGRAGDDFAASTLAGVMISAAFYWVEHPGTDLIVLLDEALMQLASGLAL